MTHLRYTQNLVDCRDASLVGGKAINLARLIAAGFPVPSGFVVTIRAFAMDDDVVDEILSAYRTMGSGKVAVRSSATAEDLADASMAGQYQTFLEIEGEQQLLAAITNCWASLDTPQARAYLKEHGIDRSQVAMAVVVQRLIDADVAGVLFTVNPNSNGRREMLIEASRGLGESVVSGKVQPDLLRLDPDTGRVIEAKHLDRACLSSKDVHQLWQLGRQAAEYFGAPQDIEWAIKNGGVYLLQSRPITTYGEYKAYEQSLRSTQQHLRSELAAGRGPWVLHNLGETLPHPTPLTWSIMQRFMSGAGGYGIMYRQAGFEPSPAVQTEGFLECIFGRIYMDASRASEMFFKDFPFAYDIEELKQNPDASQSPPTQPRGSLLTLWQAQRKLRGINQKLRQLSQKLDRELRDDLFSEIRGYVDRNKPINLQSLSVEWLEDLWKEHELLILESFAPRLMLPSLVCGMAMADLRGFFDEHFWNEDPDALAQLVSSGGLANRTLIADTELYEVAKGTRPLETWLADHGHRAATEFDLAAPRWREVPDTLRNMAKRLAAGDGPMLRHRAVTEKVDHRIEELGERLSSADRRQLGRLIDVVRRYVAFREDSKDFLMLGYDLLRDVALEIGRRLEIGADVFFLTRDEMLGALRIGYAPIHLIEQRKTTHKVETRFSPPRVIDAQSIETLGEQPEIPAIEGGKIALAISTGQATGPAKILHSPTESADLGRGYILVCPSTDPAWTPLFVNAAGLVLECGGTLSHGAVVAREMGLPAVVLPNATKLFRDGEEIRVDGNRGWVGPATTIAETSSMDEKKNRIPGPGKRDRRAARIRNVMAIIWGIFLLAFFALPKNWVHEPTMAWIDKILWPLVRTAGKPAAVAIIAFGIATLTLLLQKLLTDNDRLLEAKRRTGLIKDKVNNLASVIQYRSLMAAMIPIGILLGPMVMPLIWFHQRIDPAVWTAPAGSSVQIVTTVDGDWGQPVSIKTPESIVVDESTPASRTLPPIRKTLEHLLALYAQPAKESAQPWELQVAPDISRQLTIDDLKAYLSTGIPPQGMTWLIRPPEGFSGEFPVTVSAAGQSPITLNIVLGEQYPPTQTRVLGPAGSVIKELRAVYPKPKQDAAFWKPFAGIDVGWLWTYIIAYVPALMLVRRVLKVA